jgi:hypothetical protein
MTMVAPHLRQRIFARRAWTFSSAIEYLAEQEGQEIFTIGLSGKSEAVYQQGKPTASVEIKYDGRPDWVYRL